MTSFAGVPRGEFSYYTKGARYDGSSRGEAIQELWAQNRCPFCNEALFELPPGRQIDLAQKRLFICQLCGWWKAWYKAALPGDFIEVCRAGALLRTLDLTDASAPVEEVRSYLAGRYQTRFEIHPRIFEETVGSVFAGMGYTVDVTAYTADGGVDVILESGTERIGVQVKRSKNTINVDQIREFAGALLVGGITKGIFVTTSDFSKGARQAAEISGFRGYPIQLVDAPAFYDALRVSKRETYRSIEEFEQELPLEFLPPVYHGPGHLHDGFWET
jgi:hypothetical protein